VPEKQVAGLFTLSMLGTVLFVLAYFLVDIRTMAYLPGIGDMSLQHVLLGVGMGLALLGIGLGAVHWAKTLMPDEEVVEMRHPMRSSDADRDEVVRIMKEEGGKAQLSRRPLLKYTLGGAMSLFALPVLLPVLGGLGPMPQKSMSLTFWNGGPSGPGEEPAFTPMRLMRDPENTVRSRRATSPSARSSTSCPRACSSELRRRGQAQRDQAKSTVLLMRLHPGRLPGHRQEPQGARLGPPGHRRLLQDLHPRRLPGRPLRAADPPPAVPVPPVDLRRHRRLRGDLRPGQASAAAVEDHRRRRGLPRRRRSRSAEPVGPSFWERES
jgi:hypothetical protein